MYGQRCDGVVCPTRATADASNTWLIGRSTYTLALKNRTLWEALPRASGLDPSESYELDTAKLSAHQRWGAGNAPTVRVSFQVA